MRQSLKTGERVDGPWDNLENNPHGLAIDPLDEKLYWGRYTEIVRANLDATEMEVILSDLPLVDRLKLDVLGGKIYWLGGLEFQDEQPVRSLWRANLDGSARETVIEDFPMADFYLEMALVADADFRIVSTKLTEVGLLIAWNGNPGERYQIEGSADLGNGWVVVESAWPSNSLGVTAYLIGSKELAGLRYFRVKR